MRASCDELGIQVGALRLCRLEDLDELLGNALTKTARFQIRRDLLRNLKQREQAERVKPVDD